MIKGTENLPVGDLISKRVPFVIPVYQRGYAWEKEEVIDFINDILSLYKIRIKDSSKPKKHFFGGIVSVERYAPNTNTMRVFEVVDGQQRLATFMIAIGLMIKALQTLAVQARQIGDLQIEKDSKAHAEQTKRSFLTYEEVGQGQLSERLRLTLSKVDHMFFENLLLGIVKPKIQKGQDSNRRLNYAFGQIQSKLFEPFLNDNSSTPQSKLEYLLTLLRCITDDCHAIFIVSDDRHEAYHLFTTLNDRGRTLSNGDLLRSYTLELLEGDQLKQQQIESYWHTILAGKYSQTDDFLHSYYISFKGERVSKRDLFDYFREGFFKYEAKFPPDILSNVEAVQIVDRITNMESLSRIYPKLERGEWPYEDSVVSAWERNRLFRLIKILQHTLCFPLLLCVFDQLDETDFSALVQVLDRFVFRYITVVGVHEGKLADRYYHYCKEIRRSPASYRLNDIESDLQTLISSDAPDSLFETNLEAKLSYSESSTQKRKIKHFLTTIEDHHQWFLNGAAGKPKANQMTAFDLDQISIEHIYPQKPKPPDIDIALEPFEHDIGNLTFWAPRDNSSASNQPFSAKKTKYTQSSVMLNHELASLLTWDIHTLTERRKQLIQKAKKLFTV